MSRDYNLNRIPQGGWEDDSRERETRLVRGEWSKARRESKTQPGGQGRNQNRPQNHQPQKQLKNVEGTSVTESRRAAREKKPAKATRRTTWRGNRLIYSTTIWYHKRMGCQCSQSPVRQRRGVCLAHAQPCKRQLWGLLYHKNQGLHRGKHAMSAAVAKRARSVWTGWQKRKNLRKILPIV